MRSHRRSLLSFFCTQYSHSLRDHQCCLSNGEMDSKGLASGNAWGLAFFRVDGFCIGWRRSLLVLYQPYAFFSSTSASCFVYPLQEKMVCLFYIDRTGLQYSSFKCSLFLVVSIFLVSLSVKGYGMETPCEMLGMGWFVCSSGSASNPIRDISESGKSIWLAHILDYHRELLSPYYLPWDSWVRFGGVLLLFC